MISMERKNKILRYVILYAVILLLDILVIIGNIYIAPILENFGMPDVLIYIKTLISLTGFIIFLLYYNDKIPLTYEVIKIILYLTFLSIVSYFFSMYLYKYALLSTVSDDILLKILTGNPSLVLDISRTNYNVLQYLITIYSGANSELFLFIQGLFLQFTIIKSKELVLSDEEAFVYDEFLYDKTLKFAIPLLLILSFLSINLFTFRFDLFGLIEMGISLLAFGIILPSVYLISRVSKTKNTLAKPSLFVGSHYYFKFMSIVSIVLFTSLIGINTYFIIVNRGTYRIMTATLALITSIIILVKSHIVLSLQNK